MPAALPGPPDDRRLPTGFRVRMDPRVRVWSGGEVLVGGSPWGVSRLAGAARQVIARLAAAGAAGVPVDDALVGRVARALLDRGFAVPVLPARAESTAGPEIAAGFETTAESGVVTVVPTLDRAESVDELLADLGGPVVIVDDASLRPDELAAVTRRHGAVLVRHAVNRGPAAARNTGLVATDQEFVAFLDSDCRAPGDWARRLLGHFDDPAVGMVAPRIVPDDDERTVLERYERTRSSLDMGQYPELVRPGARLGFVPSAAVVVRRSALGESGFDEDLRLGEDVDLVWRLGEAGWLVRYDPSVLVAHRTRTSPREWLVRRFEYGTSAASLDARHPGRLAPARVTAWNVATWLLALRGHLPAAAVTSATAAVLLHRRLRHLPDAPPLAARIVGQGLLADGAAIGHMLRREWWPVGAVAMVAAPRSRIARGAVLAMLLPIAMEWTRGRSALDPVRYTGLRLVEDAAYGTGVIASCWRQRTLRPLLPVVRLPKLPGTAGPSTRESRPPQDGSRLSRDQRSSAPPSTGSAMPVM